MKKQAWQTAICSPEPASESLRLDSLAIMSPPASSNFRVGFLTTILMTVVIHAAPILGQDGGNPGTNPPATAQETVPSPPLPSGTQLIYKDPATGKVTPLPGFSPEMLKSLQLRATSQINRLHDIRKVDIKGSVEGDFAHLAIQAWIDITVENEWVVVPLAFDEFQIVDPTPTSRFTPWGENQETITEAIGQRFQFVQDDQPSKSFRLFGKGTHAISFHLIGQVRTANDRQRLKLTAPAANQSRLKLQIPELVSDVQWSTERPLDQAADPKTGITEIETWGLAEQMELSWQRQINNADRPTSIRQTSATRMKLDLTSQPPSLTAVQSIQISGTPISSAVLQFPSGYADLSVTATSASDKNVLVDVVEREDQQTLLEFDSPVSGAIELTYSIEYDSSRDIVVIRPPDLEGCDSETADFNLLVPAGLQVDIQRTGDGSVKQQRTDASAGPRTTQTSQVAYRMLSAESELTLRLQETVAFYSVVPTITFETEESILLMTATFSVNVLQGSIDEVMVAWPGYKDWQLLNDYTQLVVGAASFDVIPDRSWDDQFRLEFPQRQSQQFAIRIEAMMDLQEFQDRNLPLSLPDLPTTTSHSATVSLLDSDEHSMQLRSADGLTEFPPLPSSRWPNSFRGTEDARTVRIVDTPSRPIKLLIEQQRSETKTESVLNLSLEDQSIRVQQILSYDVRYRDIDEIKLNAVPGINPVVRLRSTMEPLPETSTEQQTLSFPLPEPVRGQFDLLIDYFVPLPAESIESEKLVDVPLVVPATIERTLKFVQIRTDEVGKIAITSSDWSRIYSDSAASAWIARNPVASAPVSVRTGESSAQDRAELLVLKSAVANDKMLSSTTYVPTDDQTSVRFRIPASTRVVATSVNGRTTDYVETKADGSRQIELRTNANVIQATVVIQQNVQSRTLFETIKPSFAQPVGVSDDSVCLWMVRRSGGSIPIPTNPEVIRMPLTAGQAPSRAENLLAALPLPLAEAQEAQLLRNLEEATIDADAVSVFSGMLLQNNHTVYILSRQTVLLAAAVLGLLTYVVLVSLRILPILTVTAITICAAVIIMALVPPASYDAMLRILPGCVVAAIAALLQRLFSGGREQLVKEAATSDSSTIFAINQSAHQSPVQTESGQPIAAFPSQVS